MRLSLLGLCLLLLPWPVWAARSIQADKEIVARLDPFQPTSIQFPVLIASTLSGLPKELLAVGKDGHYLYLIAGDPSVTGHLFVVDQNGKQYKVSFKIGTPADDMITIVSPPPVPQAVAAQPCTVLTVLRALRTETTLPHATPAEIPAPAFQDTRLALLNTQALSVCGFIGMVLTLQNTQDAPLGLDVRVGVTPDIPTDEVAFLTPWTWPPRLTVKGAMAETELIPPLTTTRVFVVFERRP